MELRKLFATRLPNWSKIFRVNDRVRAILQKIRAEGRGEPTIDLISYILEFLIELFQN